ncbi:ThiF family adenylyltransferase [Microbacterium thalassium]|uniref:Adenylyltransferase/sulfurtransferase n=1 Tax=Microbacterium thalassium TaxID=362649 RepID=A0A7X0FSD4_9MICO|nr:ThiF family adenylyltransferase [Microbacterium thalassium]MBB6392840.1 adenylyltransferase/sulfurtransferase [Microbacterium thalassium]GLK22929.1 molybdopterin/thiamine biosynthesis dinucleotide-utilizing protein [Microbacterium thalassium]
MPLPPLVEPVAALSPAERARTARHRALAQLGELGQRRLAAAHVAVVGAGGLGSPVILALAAAGVGTLTVIDNDDVEASNLQRQVIHRREDVGAAKVDSAARAAASLSDTAVTGVRERLTAGNATRHLTGADLVIDGSDTFDTREAVAAACEALGVPLVWGTVQEFDGQVTVFWAKPPAGVPGVRLGDLYPPGSTGDVPTCADVGVLGALCLQVGSLMALEAVKLIAGIGDPLLGRVLVVDALRARQREVPLRAARTDAVPPPASAGEATGAEPVMPSAPPLVQPNDLDPDAATVVDVRESGEVAQGMIRGALHMPLARLLADPRALDGAADLVIVCQAGVRARRAAEALQDAGIPASVLAGGMDAWTAHHGARA